MTKSRDGMGIRKSTVVRTTWESEDRSTSYEWVRSTFDLPEEGAKVPKVEETVSLVRVETRIRRGKEFPFRTVFTLSGEEVEALRNLLTS